MLRQQDITLDVVHSPLGRLCIFTDSDRPCATMLVFVRRKIEGEELYYVEYIRPGRHVHGEIGPVPAEYLTPVEHWGLLPVYDSDAGLLRLHRMAETPTATYKDGKPRPWQGHYVTGLHPSVADDVRKAYDC